jgi:hypothetical protein
MARFPGYLGCILFILLLNASLVNGATPEPVENPGTFSFYFENDLFFNTDEHYTTASN